jgi:hypothetical protein
MTIDQAMCEIEELPAESNVLFWVVFLAKKKLGPPEGLVSALACKGYLGLQKKYKNKQLVGKLKL